MRIAILVSSLELHKQCWTSLEICVEPAITLFGRQAPEVVSLLLLQLYAFEDLYDLPNHKGLARHARRKCEDLMDVKLEGEVSLPWLSARDPSMRYTSELLRAEATQHLASRQQRPWATPRAPLISMKGPSSS